MVLEPFGKQHTTLLSSKGHFFVGHTARPRRDLTRPSTKGSGHPLPCIASNLFATSSFVHEDLFLVFVAGHGPK